MSIEVLAGDRKSHIPGHLATLLNLAVTVEHDEVSCSVSIVSALSGPVLESALLLLSDQNFR